MTRLDNATGRAGSTAEVTDMVEAAEREAAAAARAAGVSVEGVDDLAGLGAVYRLVDDVWRPAPQDQPVTPELLRALSKGGNYVGAAHREDRLVGAAVGFCGPPREAVLHSHIAGVAPGLAGRGVGFALKMHQRAWALRRGIGTIGWTFDPLVRRNAYFNLAKLGAVAVEYLPDFYGRIHDAINGDDATDRLLVHWELADADVAAACGGRPLRHDADAERGRGAVVALDRGEDGGPVPGPRPGSRTGATVLVAVPTDVETLRSTDPDRAREWRVALRDVLAPLLADGARIGGFDRSGWFLVTR